MPNSKEGLQRLAFHSTLFERCNKNKFTVRTSKRSELKTHFLKDKSSEIIHVWPEEHPEGRIQNGFYVDNYETNNNI